MGFFDFVKSKDSNEVSLEEKLSVNLLTDEMQGKVYREVQSIKHYSDQLLRSQSQDDIENYQQSVIDAFEPTVEIYEWLKEKGISELNAIVLLASFYLINLSDVTFKEATSFSDMEIANTVDTFLATMGVQQGKVDTSSYNELVRVGVRWLLKHPNN